MYKIAEERFQELYNKYVNLTIEKDGVAYDSSQSQILSISQDIIELSIPEGVRSLPEKCFMGNKTIKRVKFPSSIESIPKAAFMDCESLEEVDLSQIETTNYSKVIVGSAAFCNCKSLTKIDLSKLMLENNAELTFAYCIKLESIKGLKLPINVGNSKMNFFHCDNLKQLINQYDYPHYGEFDLAYCLNLKNAIISQRDIDRGLFCGCENLESLTLSFT